MTKLGTGNTWNATSFPTGGVGWKHPLYVAGFETSNHHLLHGFPGLYQDDYGNCYGGCSFSNNNDAHVGIVDVGNKGPATNLPVPIMNGWRFGIPDEFGASDYQWGYCFFGYFQEHH